MYPFQILLLGSSPVPQAGPVAKAYTFTSPSSDVGSTGLTGSIPQTLVILTEDGGLYGTGANLNSALTSAMFGQNAPDRYGAQWFTFETSGVVEVYPHMSGFIYKMQDGTYHIRGIMIGGTADANNVWTAGTLNMANVKKLAVGEDHALLLMNDGTLYGVGNNSYGALGVSTQNITTPRQIDTGVADIFSTQYCTAYYLKGNTLYASGFGGNGALMNGSTSNRASFAAVTVAGGTGNVQAFTAGYLGNKIKSTGGTVYVTGEQYSTGSDVVLTSPTALASPPSTTTGFSFVDPLTYRDAQLLTNGDKTKYFANPRLGKVVGLASEAGVGAQAFVEVLTGVDHTLTTAVAVYAGGTILINNGNIYQCGLNRCFQSPQGTQNIVSPLTKTNYPLP